jgi:2-polyprenyl-3-methyl-5-hydroxy-6-metoxy-1,4-benzoquinol methylase
MTSDITRAYIDRLERFNGGMHWSDTLRLIQGYVHEGQSVLDWGCGIGTLCDRLTAIGCNTTGVEINADLLEFACNRYPKLAFRSVSAEMGRPGLYDVIVLNHVLGHITQPLATLLYLKEFKLAIGGKFVIATPNKLYEQLNAIPNWFRGYKSDSTLRHRWHGYELKADLRSLGLKVLKEERVGKRLFDTPESNVLLIGEY